MPLWRQPSPICRVMLNALIPNGIDRRGARNWVSNPALRTMTESSLQRPLKYLPMKLHLEAFIDVFVAVVRLAGEAGLVQLGNVSTDGTKIQGHASRHKAMSYGYMKREVERLREDIEALVTQAYQQDEAEEAALGRRRGDELPAELARREDRLATIEAAMRRLEARAKAEAEAERQRRAEAEAERQRTGQKRRGKVPKPVEEAPADNAQISM